MPDAPIMNPPRMPKWFGPVWDWAGKASDVLGRLKTLRNVILIAAALLAILGELLRRVFGWWGAALIVVAVAMILFAVVDQIVYRRAKKAAGARPSAKEEAGQLAEELRAFHIEQGKGLPPLNLVLVGQSPPGALEAWRTARDWETVGLYHKVFRERVVRIYEALKAERGYGHPLMEGRYLGISKPGEIFTIASALADMAGVKLAPLREAPESPESNPAS